MKKTNKKGFTLVELLVVIAIIAILSVVSIVGYTSFTTRAKESNAKTELSQLTTHIYAASAIANSKISIQTNKIEVEAASAEAALQVIRDEISEDLSETMLNRLTLLSASTVNNGKVSVEKLYYKVDDKIVAEWTVATNELEINPATGLVTSNWSH